MNLTASVTWLNTRNLLFSATLEQLLTLGETFRGSNNLQQFWPLWAIYWQLLSLEHISSPIKWKIFYKNSISELPINENETIIFTGDSNPNSNRSIDALTAIKHNLYEHPGLKLGHINVNGLKGKLSEIRMLLVETSLDILAVMETKLANDTTDEDIEIEGYFTIRNDRDKNGDGVLLYYKDS